MSERNAGSVLIERLRKQTPCYATPFCTVDNLCLSCKTTIESADRIESLEAQLSALRDQQPVAWRSWGVIEGHSYVTDDATTVAEWKAKGIDVFALYAAPLPTPTHALPERPAAAAPVIEGGRLTPEQEALYDLMSDISEDCYCAGWMHDNEFRLWRALVDPTDDLEYGMNDITSENVERMRYWSAKIGGWIYWHDDAYDPHLPSSEWGPRFIPLAAWEQRYAQFLRVSGSALQAGVTQQEDSGDSESMKRSLSLYAHPSCVSPDKPNVVQPVKEST